MAPSSTVDGRNQEISGSTEHRSLEASNLWYVQGGDDVSGTRTPSGINTLYRIVKCPQLGGFRYISGGGGLCNQAVEHNVPMFSELSLAIC